MNGYFNPLRRRLGVLTLVMACVFAAGWVRGGIVQDSVAIPVTSDSTIEINTNEHSLSLKNGRPTIAVQLMPATTPNESPFSIPVDELIGESTAERQVAMIELATEQPLEIPYWSVVLPLTVLSAWLLLSKLRVTSSPSPPNVNEAETIQAV